MPKIKNYQSLQQTVARTINTRRPINRNNTRQRGLVIAADVRKNLDKPNVDVHTTKTHGRERDGADDIHHEG
jgi:hypothetical protein